VLTPQAVRKLFATLRRLAAEGCSILYISHKLDEIQELCDTATVMRGGRVTGHVKPKGETHASLAQLMVGHSLPDYTRREHNPGAVLLDVKQLSVASDDPFGTSLRDVSFGVHAGEIFGIAGVSGNGQAELLSALSGEKRGARADAVTICGKPAGRLGAGGRRALGFGFVPEERLGRGAVPAMSLSENALLTAHRQQMVSSGWIKAGAMRAFAKRCIDAFDVRCGGPEALAQSLSGGNLQKYIMGREILQAPKVLVVAQPTWGVDGGGVHPPAAARSGGARRRDSGDLGGTGRAVRHLRSHRGARRRPALAGARDGRDQCRGNRPLDGGPVRWPRGRGAVGGTAGARVNRARLDH
jgi:simple sugar transport system ATP-binding protein